jgi:hypothetical protein
MEKVRVFVHRLNSERFLIGRDATYLLFGAGRADLFS